MGCTKRIAYYGSQFIALIFFLFSNTLQAQLSDYNSLIGSQHPLRNYNVTFYHLDISIDPSDKTIEGNNRICFTRKIHQTQIQLELHTALTIQKITCENNEIPFTRDSMRVLVNLPVTSFNETTKPDSAAQVEQCIVVYYIGAPVAAKNAPWDGGVVWSKDVNDRPWVGVAVQTDGAHFWWPCKSSWADRPDSMRMTFRGPLTSKIISNGKLLSEKKINGQRVSDWQVSTPIAPYNVSFYLGNYKTFTLPYKKKALRFYTLDYNTTKAKKHFLQCIKLMEEYEKLFDVYPFWQDGFKVVESPYLGMEHQTAIAYGNEYINDVFDYDFILLHEIAHEWWGNSVSATDPAYMWIHETMATYTEALFFEKIYGKEKAQLYLMSQKTRIQNKNLIEGIPGRNFHDYPDADMYFRGTWMMHTIRHHIHNDSLWFSALHDLYDHFYMKIITGEEFISKLSELCKEDLSPIFNYFLHTTEEPQLYFWQDTESTFQLYLAKKVPFRIYSGDVELKLTQRPQEFNLTNTQLQQIHHNYYLDLKKIE